MNQSLALLYKDPFLAEELRDDIREWKRHRQPNISLKRLSADDLSPRAEELVKAERGDISELMTTSFSETRTTEELLPAESEEVPDDEEEEEAAFQNRPYPPRIGTPRLFFLGAFSLLVSDATMKSASADWLSCVTHSKQPVKWWTN